MIDRRSGQPARWYRSSTKTDHASLDGQRSLCGAVGARGARGMAVLLGSVVGAPTVKTCRRCAEMLSSQMHFDELAGGKT